MEDNKILEMREQDIIAKLKEEREIPSATVVLESLGIPVALKGLTRKELDRARKISTHGKKEELNSAEYDANVVIAATTNFNWNAAKPSNISDAAQFLMRKCLAGEISNLAGKVLELSGYGDELEEAEDIKNLSAEEE